MIPPVLIVTFYSSVVSVALYNIFSSVSQLLTSMWPDALQTGSVTVRYVPERVPGINALYMHTCLVTAGLPSVPHYPGPKRVVVPSVSLVYSSALTSIDFSLFVG